LRREQTRWLGKEFTLSSHEKSALFSLLKAADPKGIATNNVVIRWSSWSSCDGYSSSTSGGKAKIASVSAVLRGCKLKLSRIRSVLRS